MDRGPVQVKCSRDGRTPFDLIATWLTGLSVRVSWVRFRSRSAWLMMIATGSPTWPVKS